MKARKSAVLVLILMLANGLFSGCGNAKPTAMNTNKTVASISSSSYISNEKITIKYWMAPSATKYNLKDNLVYKELEKRTNIHIEFMPSVSGQEIEEFNLMIASNTLPDIIQSNYANYLGGPDKAIADEVFLRLNELIDKYAPDYKRIRESDSNIAKETISDAGNIYSFDCIQLGEEQPWEGLIIRNDWLKDLGLKLPTTMDEWHRVLTAFKEVKNVQAPLIFNGLSWQMAFTGAFISAYGVINDFYNENGIVKYGIIEPGYKEFLTTMYEWYKEGLIDKDFAIRDEKNIDDLFTSGRAGAMFQSYGRFPEYITAGRKNDVGFGLSGVPNPVKMTGEKLHFRQINYHNKGTSAIITAACKNPVEVVKWLNYAYTDEGFLLFNYGVQNVSWRWVDGPVKSTEKQFFPKTLQDSNIHPEFIGGLFGSAEDNSYMEYNKYKIHQTAQLRNPMAFNYFDKEVLDAMDAWGGAGNDYMMPLISLTEDENEKLSVIMNNINAYVNEMQIKFITGKEPLSKFDNFVEQIKKMKIGDAIVLKQAALDRYKKR